MEDSKLTDEQKQKIKDWIESKSKKNASCAICEGKIFTINKNLMSVDGIGGEIIIPMALVYCDNCFHATFFCVKDILEIRDPAKDKKKRWWEK